MSSWRCCVAVAVRGKRTWRDAVHVLVVRLRQCRIGNEWAFRGSDNAHDVSQVGVRVGSCAGLWVERVAGLVVVLRLKGGGPQCFVFPDSLKSQTASPITDHFHHFSPRWSALWVACPLNPPPSRRRAGDSQRGSRACRRCARRMSSCCHTPEPPGYRTPGVTGAAGAAPVQRQPSPKRGPEHGTNTERSA